MNFFKKKNSQTNSKLTKPDIEKLYNKHIKLILSVTKKKMVHF